MPPYRTESVEDHHHNLLFQLFMFTMNLSMRPPNTCNKSTELFTFSDLSAAQCAAQPVPPCPYSTRQVVGLNQYGDFVFDSDFPLRFRLR